LLLYENGALNKEQTVELLKVKRLFNQYVFTSERAYDLLRFKTSFVPKGAEK
jgi:hypothetical protein